MFQDAKPDLADAERAMPEKKPYTRPRVTVLGKISDVTLAGTGSVLEQRPRCERGSQRRQRSC